MGFKRKKHHVHGLIQIEDKLISQALIEERFMCDLAKCKGACCVEGDVGAPLDDDELAVLDEIYEEVSPYLRPEGQRAIEEQGTSVRDFTGAMSTPLVEGKECAYVTFNEQGIALCGIEQAYFDGKISFRKPISCHLYPIRISKFTQVEALNYDEWDICSPACAQGEAKGIRTYEFLKGALERKYGPEFYEELDRLAKAYIAQTEEE